MEKAIEEKIERAKENYSEEDGIKREIHDIKIESYDPEAHTIVFCATSDALDYSNEKVNPNGVSIAPHPMVLVGHDSRSKDFGEAKIISTWQKDNKWYFKVEFNQKHPRGVLMEYNYANGFAKFVSIGFKTFWEFVTFIEDVLIHNKVLIHELSLVALGCNPEAVAKDYSFEQLYMITKSCSDKDTKTFFNKVKDLKYNKMEEAVNAVQVKYDELTGKFDTVIDTIKNLSEKIAEFEKNYKIEPEHVDPEVKGISVEDFAKLIIENKKLNDSHRYGIH